MIGDPVPPGVMTVGTSGQASGYDVTVTVTVLGPGATYSSKLKLISKRLEGKVLTITSRYAESLVKPAFIILTWLQCTWTRDVSIPSRHEYNGVSHLQLGHVVGG